MNWAPTGFTAGDALHGAPVVSGVAVLTGARTPRSNPKFYKLRLVNSPAEADEYLVMAHLLERDSAQLRLPTETQPCGKSSDTSRTA